MFQIIFVILMFIAIAALIMWSRIHYGDTEPLDNIYDEETWRKHGL